MHLDWLPLPAGYYATCGGGSTFPPLYSESARCFPFLRQGQVEKVSRTKNSISIVQEVASPKSNFPSHITHTSLICPQHPCSNPPTPSQSTFLPNQAPASSFKTSSQSLSGHSPNISTSGWILYLLIEYSTGSISK